MLRKISTVAVAALMSSATFVAAEEHTIFFLGDGFFPEVSYVKPGDTVRFINNSTATMNIVSADEAWSVGPVAVNASGTLDVTGNTVLQFFEASDDDDDEDLGVEGNLSFDPAPLG